MWLTSVVRFLISGQAGYLNAELLGAARKGRTPKVEALLARGADPNARDRKGRSPLMRAASSQRTETVRALVGSGAAVNARDVAGQTALIHATASCRAPFSDVCTGTVKELLGLGAEVNARDQRCRTALMYAARSLCAKTVSALLEQGADVNAVDHKGSTALMYAVGEEVSNAPSDFMPKHEPDEAPRLIGVFGGLTLAAWEAGWRQGVTSIVSMLAAGGADINAQNKDGRSALMIAVGRRFTRAVEALLLHGADVNRRDKDGLTALGLATSFVRHAQITRVLVKAGGRE
jgi:ankyrin repeat protein